MSQFYYYDPETCEFKDIQYTNLEKLVHAFTQWSLFGIVIGGLLVIFLSLFAGTPAEIALQAENRALLEQLRANRTAIEGLDEQISRLEEADNEIYRQVLGMDRSDFEAQLQRGQGGAPIDPDLDVLQQETADLIRWMRENLDRLDRRANLQLQSFEEVKAYYKANQEKMRHIPAIRPIGSDVVSGFGMRMHPVLNFRRMHEGLDFRASIGTDIYATGDGIVTQAEFNSSYGRMIRINHGHGFETIYAHLSRYAPQIRVGRRVTRGEVIGYSGDSGLVEAPHLHYEVIRNGSAVNPIFYLFADISPEEYLQYRRISEENDSSLD